MSLGMSPSDAVSGLRRAPGRAWPGRAPRNEERFRNSALLAQSRASDHFLSGLCRRGPGGGCGAARPLPGSRAPGETGACGHRAGLLPGRRSLPCPVLSFECSCSRPARPCVPGTRGNLAGLREGQALSLSHLVEATALLRCSYLPCDIGA